MRRLSSMSVVLCVSLSPATLADDDDLSTADLIEALRTQVVELRDTVAELKAADDDNWLTERWAAEIRSLVEDVLADANTRASLLQDGATAGWDRNFYLQSADGNWRMRLRGQLQVRWVYSHADGQAPAEPDDLYGFEVRRAKIKFDGHVIDPTWKFNISLAVDHDDTEGDLEMEDAFFRKVFENGLTVWGGQFKLEFNREELTSSTAQLAVDRSVVNEIYNLDRSPGVMVQYTGDQFRLWGGLSDGAGHRSAGFDSPDLATAATGRVDWLAAGDWTQFKDFRGWRGQEFAAMVGGAVHYQKSKYGAPFSLTPGGRVERFTWTIDGQVEGDGWNVFAYVLGNHLSFQDSSPGADQIAFVVQGGYMLTDTWELYGRYEWSDLDDNAEAGESDFVAGLSDVSILTLGVNYYIDKHAKWTTDIGLGLDAVPVSERGVGWRADAPSQDGQFVLRTQFQLLF